MALLACFSLFSKLTFSLLGGNRTQSHLWFYFLFLASIFGSVQQSRLEFITLDRDLLANPQTAEIVTYSFGTLPRATLTLLQVMGQKGRDAHTFPCFFSLCRCGFGLWKTKFLASYTLGIKAGRLDDLLQLKWI